MLGFSLQGYGGQRKKKAKGCFRGDLLLGC
jgi:hypothetical protein